MSDLRKRTKTIEASSPTEIDHLTRSRHHCQLQQVVEISLEGEPVKDKGKEKMEEVMKEDD